MSPCYDCKNRFPACQSSCGIGKAYANKMKQRNDKIRAERNLENMVDEVNINATMRLKRRARSV